MENLSQNALKNISRVIIVLTVFGPLLSAIFRGERGALTIMYIFIPLLIFWLILDIFIVKQSMLKTFFVGVGLLLCLTVLPALGFEFTKGADGMALDGAIVIFLILSAVFVVVFLILALIKKLTNKS
jgi:hypothetical protein